MKNIENYNPAKYQSEKYTKVEEGIYKAEINGGIFTYDEMSPEYEKTAFALADAYKEKLPQIAAFILDDITAMFGNISEEDLTEALGAPDIDLDCKTINYLEHSLGDSYIIDVEYGGILNEFYEVSIYDWEAKLEELKSKYL